MIRISVSGVEKLHSFLFKLTQLSTRDEILDEIEALMLNLVRTRFLAQTAPDGSKWPVSRAAIRRQHSGRDGGTLFDTGTLFHSIQAYAHPPSERIIGTDVFYGKFHNEGIGQEKRVFLGFGPSDVNIIEKLVVKRIKSLLE